MRINYFFIKNKKYILLTVVFIFCLPYLFQIGLHYMLYDNLYADIKDGKFLTTIFIHYIYDISSTEQIYGIPAAMQFLYHCFMACFLVYLLFGLRSKRKYLLLLALLYIAWDILITLFCVVSRS
jgi:hypothetical protein